MGTMDCVKVEGKSKKNRRLQNEYLLNNIIDKDFQAVLFPLTLMPSLFLMSQFRIISNFITPENNALYFIKSFAGCIPLLLTHFYRFLCDTEMIGDLNSDVITFLLNFDLIFFSVISILTYTDGFSQRCNYVELIIKLQHVLNYVKIDKLAFFSKQKKRNRLSVLMVVSVYVFYGALACESFKFLEWLVNFLLVVPLLICDIQIVVMCCIIEMIKDELLAWSSIMEEYSKTHVTNGEEDTINVVSKSDLFYAYYNLIEAFRLCSKVYRFSVSYYIFQAFSHILIALELGLELEKIIPEDNISRARVMNVLYGFWNMKSITLVVILSVACENFYRSVKIAESTCSRILGYGQSTGKGMRATCKNMLRLNRAAVRKVSAFGVFELDAAFPLRLFDGIVAYTVVLLQFAFVS